MKTKITKFNQPLMLLLLIGLIAIGSACKKEKNETEAPKVDGTWSATSQKVNGNENFGVWSKVNTGPILCTQGSKNITCVGRKTMLTSCKLVLLNDQTFVWTFSYDKVENDLQKSRDNCHCEFEPLYKDDDSFGGSWYASDDGKTLALKVSSSSLDNYSIVSLEKNRLQLKLVYGQDTYEYTFVR